MKKNVSLFMAALVVAAFPVYTHAAFYSGGMGTAAAPYRISVVADWKLLMSTPADWNKYFILTADIDLIGVGLVPVGNHENVFTGKFNGNGFTLRNAGVNQPSAQYVGVFGCVDSPGWIVNLAVMNLDVKGYGFVGGLVGECSANISGCSISGAVTGSRQYVGGLIGTNWGVISDCSFSGSVTGSDWNIGGLVGQNYGAVMSSHANCTVTGWYEIGGLLGDNMGSVTSCSAAGSVVATRDFIGGLIGANHRGDITSCYATASVVGRSSVGGLVGTTSDDRITSCSATGDVSGYNSVGGLIGSNSGDVSFSFATGSITGADGVGGLAGGNGGSITSCYHTTGLVTGTHYDSGGLVGANGGRIAVSYSTGIVNGLSRVGGLAGSTGSDSVVTSSYASGPVTATDSLAGGLVGDNSGSVVSCYATGPVAETGVTSSAAGGLIGYNSGSVTVSFSTGAITGKTDAAGFVGKNTGAVTSCLTSGPVTATMWYNGGFVGENTGTVTACYSTGSVSGAMYIGGFVGWNYRGRVIRCYSTGKPTGGNSGGFCGLVMTGTNYEDTANFWDTQTSDTTTSQMGFGKTTAQMKTLATFTAAGWDFVGESANGTADLWRMCSNGVAYPRLSWEFSSDGDLACPNGVEIHDLLYLSARWLGSTPAAFGAADANADGIVNLADFALLADHWMQP